MTIQERIAKLKKEKNAVILAHYYARPEVQDIADYLGDSLGLSKLAAGTDADIIVFCGVHFMAETAAIISPQKTVLSPDPDAGCSLADSATAEGLVKWKKEHPDGIIVSYVNTTAAVKAVTDYCCTSANALEVIKALSEDRPVLFGPDRNLGSYISAVTGKKMDIWDGACVVHDVMSTEMIDNALRIHPEADILIHPEAACSSDKSLLDNSRVYFYSTAGMLKHVADSEKKEFVIATETDTIHSLEKENADKRFIPVSPCAVCAEMKKVTLEKVLDCLENETGKVILDEEISRKALIPIERMMAM